MTPSHAMVQQAALRIMSVGMCFAQKRKHDLLFFLHNLHVWETYGTFMVLRMCGKSLRLWLAHLVSI